MMIKCTKCGFENQMGAIFCRQCGEKIDMNKISPESLESDKNKEDAKKRVGKIIRWTVRILVLIVILGAGAAAFIPWGLPVYVAPDEKSADFKKKEETALFKLKLCAAENMPRLPEKADISLEEINILFDRYFLKTDENKTASWTIEHIVLVPGTDRVGMRVYVKLFGKVPMLFQIEGMPEPVSDDDHLRVRVDSATVGHLPLFFCSKAAGKKLADLLTENDELERIFKRTETITLEKDGFVFKFRRENGKAPASVPENVSAAKEDGAAAAPAAVKKARKKAGKKKASKD